MECTSVLRLLEHLLLMISIETNYSIMSKLIYNSTNLEYNLEDIFVIYNKIKRKYKISFKKIPNKVISSVCDHFNIVDDS